MTPLSSRTRHIRPGIVRLLTASLSGLQISSLDLALANGTLITLTPELNPPPLEGSPGISLLYPARETDVNLRAVSTCEATAQGGLKHAVPCLHAPWTAICIHRTDTGLADQHQLAGRSSYHSVNKGWRCHLPCK